MAAVRKHHVTIKGVKDGLLFLLDDSCTFSQVLEELRHKLEKTHQKILTGPQIHVQVKLGKRTIQDSEKEEIRSIISGKGNLLIQSIESEADTTPQTSDSNSPIETISCIVRSGQVLQMEGSVILLGDVNPGGTIIAEGDIYIMGSLRGMAHAGFEGNENAIIAASLLSPTQLRIAQIISRPPDEWGIDKEKAYMEFAYICDGVMQIDKIQHLHRVRPKA